MHLVFLLYFTLFYLFIYLLIYLFIYLFIYLTCLMGIAWFAAVCTASLDDKQSPIKIQGHKRKDGYWRRDSYTLVSGVISNNSETKFTQNVLQLIIYRVWFLMLWYNFRKIVILWKTNKTVSIPQKFLQLGNYSQ